MENVKTNYYGQSFCEVMGEKGEKMLFIVSIITFMVVLLIKGNNTLVNSFGSDGTLISYWIAFIIFIFLLAIGVGILVKYGIDIYPYFTVQSIAEENEKNDLNAIENNEGEKEEFVFKGASTLAPIETVNPVTVEKASSTSTPVDNGMVINPVIATAGMAPPIMAELLMMEDGNQEDDVIISSSDDDGFGYFGDAEDDILWNDPSMF